MQIARTCEEFARAKAAAGREEQQRVVLVPTMGALHRGHAELIRLAGTRGPMMLVVSIFVNPSQFNEAADFDRYPRDLEADCAFCSELGVDVVFAPPPEVVYPPDEEVPVGTLPTVATEPGLEDAYRPGHFAGVVRVVRRLFGLVQPGAAVFGEKDWQQLRVIEAMVKAEGLGVEWNGVGVEIIPCPTVREPDGLALSSRNTLLCLKAREAAVAIPRALEAAGASPTPDAAEVAMHGVLGSAGLEVEYALVRDAQTLGPVLPDRPARALIAARIDGVRLIDNEPWTAAASAGT